MTYDDALRVCSREAGATLAAAVFLLVYFWGAVWLLMDERVRFWGLPVWFVAAVGGGYVLSVAAAVWLVKKRFKAIPLDIVRESSGENESEAAR